jgi:MFS family permease
MGVTFVTLAITAGFRSASSVLIIPLEEAFGWGREQVSLAVAINVLVYGLVAPFAAALMERFGIRRVVMSALFSVSVGAGLTIFMNAPWQLMALWGFVVGASTGSLALVFAATVANRWFVEKRGIVIGVLTASSATGQLIFLPGLSHIAEMNGWKSVSLTITCVALVLIPLVWLFLKERPQDVGVLPYGAPADWSAPAKNSMGAGALAIDTLKRASKKKDFW